MPMTPTPRLPTKHQDVFQRRESCREALLEVRRTRATKEREAAGIRTELDALAVLEARERKRLVDLTAEAAQLLNADTAGLLGKEIAEGLVAVEHAAAAT